eukprot:CAMPEP_0194245464 /NCGR_PEP_ID=MMETSP0158-20130606/13283_1 /TAXON_ID=33649 /ORGANISM="Thalassionema nitzschioides, Strain L26-B" /LENGTH=111 /DNA_ID=CAMNT_0038981181 /DNA_START=96 /DNA_END=431 /DNA_ORIENTATION=-
MDESRRPLSEIPEELIDATLVKSLVVLMLLKDCEISVIRFMAAEAVDPLLPIRRLLRRLSFFFEVFVAAKGVVFAIGTVCAEEVTDDDDVLTEGATDSTTSTLKLSSSSSS